MSYSYTLLPNVVDVYRDGALRFHRFCSPCKNLVGVLPVSSVDDEKKFVIEKWIFYFDTEETMIKEMMVG